MYGDLPRRLAALRSVLLTGVVSEKSPSVSSGPTRTTVAFGNRRWAIAQHLAGVLGDLLLVDEAVVVPALDDHPRAAADVEGAVVDLAEEVGQVVLRVRLDEAGAAAAGDRRGPAESVGRELRHRVRRVGVAAADEVGVAEEQRARLALRRTALGRRGRRSTWRSGRPARSDPLGVALGVARPRAVSRASDADRAGVVVLEEQPDEVRRARAPRAPPPSPGAPVVVGARRGSAWSSQGSQPSQRHRPSIDMRRVPRPCRRSPRSRCGRRRRC